MAHILEQPDSSLRTSDPGRVLSPEDLELLGLLLELEIQKSNSPIGGLIAHTQAGSLSILVGLDSANEQAAFDLVRAALAGTPVAKIADASIHTETSSNPLVENPPRIRGISGAAIKSQNSGLNGVLFCADTKPRRYSSFQLASLRFAADRARASLEPSLKRGDILDLISVSKALLSHSNELIFLVSANGTVLKASESALSRMAVPGHELVGKRSIFSLLALENTVTGNPEAKPETTGLTVGNALMMALKRVATRRVEERMSLTFMTRRNEAVSVIAKLCFFQELPDQTASVLIICEDITEKRRNAERYNNLLAELQAAKREIGREAQSIRDMVTLESRVIKIAIQETASEALTAVLNYLMSHVEATRGVISVKLSKAFAGLQGGKTDLAVHMDWSSGHKDMEDHWNDITDNSEFETLVSRYGAYLFATLNFEDLILMHDTDSHESESLKRRLNATDLIMIRAAQYGGRFVSNILLARSEGQFDSLALDNLRIFSMSLRSIIESITLIHLQISQEALTAELIEHSGLCFACFSEHGDIVWLRGADSLGLGFDQTSLQNTSWRTLLKRVSRDSRNELMACLRRQIYYGDGDYVHFQTKAEDKTLRSIEYLPFRLAPVNTTGKRPRYFYGILRNVDAIKDFTALQIRLAETKNLLHEIHHRVKNNLQSVSALLYLQEKQGPDNPQTTAVLKEARSRIQAISLLHETLYGNDTQGANVNFTNLIRKLVNSTREIHGDAINAIEIAFSGDELTLDLDVAEKLSLIINELITNSLKHAFPAGQSGRIVISSRAYFDDASMQHFNELTIRDNGVGFKASNDTQRGLGFKLVHRLADQIGAVLTNESTDKGSYWSIVLQERSNE